MLELSSKVNCRLSKGHTVADVVSTTGEAVQANLNTTSCRRQQQLL